MSNTTTNRGYPYPEATDDPNVPADMAALAVALDTDVDELFTRTDTLDHPTAMNSISRNFTNNTVQQITLGADSNQWNTGNLYTDPEDRYVIPDGAQGLYEIGIIARFASQTTASGQRNVRIYKNGVEEMSMTIPATTALNATNIPVGLVYPTVLAASDAIEFYGFQNSGGALALTGLSRVWLRRLSA